MASARGVALLSWVVLLGCVSPPRAESRPLVEVASPTATPAAATPPVGATAPRPPDAPGDVVVDPGAARAARCAPLVWADAACLRDREWREPMSDEQVAQWYADRGARAPTDGLPPQCHERSVGPSSEAALVCERMTQPFEKMSGVDVFRVLLGYVIVTVRKGRPVTLFNRPYYVEVLDKERLEQGPLFALEVELSASGTEVVVRELAPHACADAAAGLREREKEAEAETDEAGRATMLAWIRFDRKTLARACASVGRYTWSAGGFARSP